METSVIVLIAAIAIVFVVVLAVRLRRTPIIGEGELGPTRHVSVPVEPDVDLASPTPEEGSRRGVHITKTIVTRRIAFRIEPDRIAITVDGHPYESLDQIADEALRADVRLRLAGIPNQIDDPTARLQVENRLRSIGVVPAPAAGPPDSD